MRTFVRVLTLSTAVLPLATRAQTVHVVDDDGGAGVHFTSLADAVTAASSGDVVLVKEGSYSGFTIDGKSLTVVEDTGHATEVTGTVNVRNLLAGQTVELIGLEVDQPNGTALSLIDNAGVVELDAIDATSAPDRRVLQITNSSAVVVSQGRFKSILSQPAIDMIDSNLHMFGAVVIGGEGIGLGGTPSGAGLRIEGGTLLAAGGSIRGGAGGAGQSLGPPFGCVSATNGGVGLRLRDGEPAVQLRDCSISGGSAGNGTVCGGSPTVDGEPIVITTGSVTELSGPARRYDLPPVAREGEVASITFTGEPGEICFWLYSLSTAPADVPILQGSLVPGAPNIAMVGSIPAEGTLTIPFTIPALPIESLKIYEQPVYFSSLFDFVAGEPLVSVLVQAGF